MLHSLGNYVFDMDFMRQTMQGVVLQATFWGPRLKAIRLLPYEMDAGTFAPRRVAGAAAAAILGDVWGSSSGPFRRQVTAQGASQDTTVRAVRRSWAGSTTAGTSPGEW